MSRILIYKVHKAIFFNFFIIHIISYRKSKREFKCRSYPSGFVNYVRVDGYVLYEFRECLFMHKTY